MLHSTTGMDYESTSFWIAVGSLVIGLVSFVVSVVATRIAKSSLSVAESSLAQTKLVADRELRDWRQMKWFDLYFMANEVWDLLEHFQSQYGTNGSDAPWDSPKMVEDFNNLIILVRKVIAMSVAFPKSPVTETLIGAIAVFKNREEALSKERLSKVFDAVQNVREKAFVHPTVLGEP